MSKFCGNCGAQLDDAAGFCGACGAKQEMNAASAPVQQEAAPAAPQQNSYYGASAGNNSFVPPVVGDAVGSDGSIAAAPKEPMSPEKKKKIIIISLIVAGVLILGLIGFLVYRNMTKYQVVDAQDLCMVYVDGINGKGTATVVFATAENYDRYFEDEIYEEFKESEFYEKYDWEGFCESKASKWLSNDTKIMKKAWDKFDSKSDMKKAQTKLMELIEFEVDEESLQNLSNGDEIKVKVKYKEEKLKKKNIKLENTEFTFTVEGLVEPIVLDPFAGTSMTFEGADGFGECTFDNSGVADEVKSLFNYTYATGYSDLSNGDVVTIEAYCWNSLNSDGYFEYGGKYYTYDANALKKDYTVSGLTELTLIDPFENITLEYSKICPNLRAEINKDACSQIVKDYIEFDYEYGALQDLDVGDTITITARVSYWYEEEFANAGYKLASEEVTKTFTVPENVPQYIQNVNQIKNFNEDEFMKAVYDDINNKVGSSYVGGFSLGGKIARIDSIALAKGYLVAPAEVAGSGNTYYQTGRIKVTLEVDGANKSKTLAFVAEFDKAYIDETGTLRSEDTWIMYYLSDSMDALVADRVINETNQAEGKLLTTLDKVPVGGNNAGQDTPDEDTQVEEPTDEGTTEEGTTEEGTTEEGTTEEAPEEEATEEEQAAA